jgi:hypothetical protein
VNLESVWQVLLPGCNVLAYLGTPTVITGPYKRETKEDLTQEERRPVTMETQTRVMQPQAREHLGQEAWRGRKDPLNGPSKALALASRAVREGTSAVLSPQSTILCYSSHTGHPWQGA